MFCTWILYDTSVSETSDSLSYEDFPTVLRYTSLSGVLHKRSYCRGKETCTLNFVGACGRDRDLKFLSNLNRHACTRSKFVDGSFEALERELCKRQISKKVQEAKQSMPRKPVGKVKLHG